MKPVTMGNFTHVTMAGRFLTEPENKVCRCHDLASFIDMDVCFLILFLTANHPRSSSF